MQTKQWKIYLQENWHMIHMHSAVTTAKDIAAVDMIAEVVDVEAMDVDTKFIIR